MRNFDPVQLLSQLRTRLHNRYVSGPFSQCVFEFICFGIKQAWACLFGGLMLCVLLGTFLFYPDEVGLARYDFITIIAIVIQASLLALKLETWSEARVILVFHIVGTVMEIFKVHVGSWGYPEDSALRIMGVPLFSGFMYACVGSYIARVWRIFDFQFDRFPPLWAQSILAVAIYINFFSHHFVPDIRSGLFLIAAVLYGSSIIWFKPDEQHRPMPLLLGLGLVAGFIWLAENIGTLAMAWSYPSQEAGWHMVSIGKLGAWFLLMLISFTLVAWMHRPVHGRS